MLNKKDISMETNRRAERWMWLMLALLFGTIFRVLPVLQSGFPVNDGGLFYSMLIDLKNAHFALPLVTSYNHLNIPFMYPPLPFYLAGLVWNFSGLSLIEVVRWFPVIFSILTIPAFFLLANTLLEDHTTAGLATILFALLPCAFEWEVMGGGLTRAPASLFLILMIWSAHRLFRGGGWKMAALTILSASIVVLSHPERALHAAASALVLLLYFGRSWKGLKQAAIVAGGVIVLTAPWWLTTLLQHGLEPFSLAFQQGGNRWTFWASFLLLDFTDEPLAVGALLAVLGAAACLKQKKTFIPVWFAFTFFVDPRSSHSIIGIQTALLAAVALTEVIFPALARLGKNGIQTGGNGSFFTSGTGRLVFAYILLLLIANAAQTIQRLGTYVLPQADRAAMDWVNTSTKMESRFIVLADEASPGLSPLQEWFPALSDRTSINTVQGREWLPGAENYKPRLQAYPALRACLGQDFHCLEAWAARQQDTFDYVYLSSLAAPGQSSSQTLLAASLLNSADYHLVYQADGVLIFAHQ
jgi:hypothetical protein